MIEITAYQSVDGSVHLDHDEAKKHDLDCIGETIDGILLEACSATGGNITRNTQYRMCLHLLDNRGKIKSELEKLVKYLNNESVN